MVCVCIVYCFFMYWVCLLALGQLFVRVLGLLSLLYKSIVAHYESILRLVVLLLCVFHYVSVCMCVWIHYVSTVFHFFCSSHVRIAHNILRLAHFGTFFLLSSCNSYTCYTKVPYRTTLSVRLLVRVINPAVRCFTRTVSSLLCRDL